MMGFISRREFIKESGEAALSLAALSSFYLPARATGETMIVELNAHHTKVALSGAAWERVAA